MKIRRYPHKLCAHTKMINSLTVIKRNKENVVTEWNVNVDGLNLTWQQKDTLDLKNNRVSFEQENGVFAQYYGCWEIIPAGARQCTLKLRVNMDWGIPVLKPYVGSILKKKSVLIFKRFLDIIKKAASHG